MHDTVLIQDKLFAPKGKNMGEVDTTLRDRSIIARLETGRFLGDFTGYAAEILQKLNDMCSYAPSAALKSLLEFVKVHKSCIQTLDALDPEGHPGAAAQLNPEYLRKQVIALLEAMISITCEDGLCADARYHEWATQNLSDLQRSFPEAKMQSPPERSAPRGQPVLRLVQGGPDQPK